MQNRCEPTYHANRVKIGQRYEQPVYPAENVPPFDRLDKRAGECVIFWQLYPMADRDMARIQSALIGKPSNDRRDLALSLILVVVLVTSCRFI